LVSARQRDYWDIYTLEHFSILWAWFRDGHVIYWWTEKAIQVLIWIIRN